MAQRGSIGGGKGKYVFGSLFILGRLQGVPFSAMGFVMQKNSG